MNRLFIGLILFLCIAAKAANTGTQTAATLSPETLSPATRLVELKTDLGTMVVELYGKEAPHTVENFLSLVNKGFYDGVIFHRVIPGFVAQAGGYTFDFQHKPTQRTVVNESANALKNTRGTLAMARTRDPDSASTQFYINLRDNPTLDAKADKPGYTVFGKVIEGFAVAEKIAQEPRGQYRSFPDAPNVPVRILEANVVQPNEALPARNAQ
jgi:peptidyl-prolyl cis-trans isomerase A (cyclophilin A)